MSNRIPYTYYVEHKATGLKYYGSKYGADANPNTFWKTGGYFTSSPKVKELLNEHSPDEFRAEVRKVFATPDEALTYENRFLTKVNAVNSDKWLNQHIGVDKFRNVGPASEKILLAQRNKRQTPEGNAKRSKSLMGRYISEETKQKMSLAQRNRPKEQEELRRDKIREKATGRGHDDTTKTKLSSIVSNTRWVSKEGKQKKVLAEELEQYINDCWVRGRILSVVVCPHCGTTGVKHNIVRRHFDKCSKKSL